MEVGAQKESQEELPGTKNKRKQRKQHIEENQDKQKQNNKERHWERDGDVFTKTRLMPVLVFWCFGVEVLRV